MDVQTTKRILISGWSGFVGHALKDQFSSQGMEVYGLSRNPSSEFEIAWDYETQQIDQEKLENFDLVIHLSGENIASGFWTEEKKQKIYQSRVKGTQFLVESLSQCEKPPSTFICASAIGYYGDRGEEVLNEDSIAGKSFLSKVCVEWEAEAKKAESMGARVVMLRFGIVLGKGGALSKMLPTFSKGLGGQLGDGQQYMSWIDLRDLCRMVDFVWQHSDIEGPINATSPNPVSNQVFTKALSDALDKPTLLRIPKIAVKAILGEGAEEAFASVRALPEKIQSLGFQFEYPKIEQSLQSIVEQL
ncbi:MAG: TIGR01777 family oxidoreductase [Bdellovibrionales bacterium]|nr:TIGR01777 family oxidoreductase [Bdellovibrionales bacterium]